MKRLKNGEAKFADHKQVGEWLESWGTTSEGDPPKWPNVSGKLLRYCVSSLQWEDLDGYRILGNW